MKQPQSITSLPESPEDDRRRRMVQYGIAMAIRIACIVLCLFVSGWWLVLPILGALVLPYIAVVLANVGPKDTNHVLRPGSVLSLRGPDDRGADE